METGTELPGLLGALVLGLVLGYLARFVLPGRQRLGCLSTVVLGAIAAVVGAVLVGATAVSLPVVFAVQLGVAIVLVGLVGGVGRRR